MGDGIEFDGEIKGFEEIKTKLADLSTKFADKAERIALREGAKIVQAQLVADAPVGETGQTRAAIKVRAAKRKKGRIAMLVLIGKGFFRGDTFYAGFTNWGYTAGGRRIRKAGADKGKKNYGAPHKIPGTLWLEKGWEKAKSAAVGRIISKLAELLEKYTSNSGDGK